MRTINTTFKTFGASLLLLGLKGDSNATEILIDCAESLEEYQGTMAAMSITGPDDTVYPGDISLDEDGIVHWVVAARDCGIAGNGSARVDLVDDLGTVVASAEARTIIMKTNMQGVAPDQIANWTEAASVALQEARAALLDLIDLDTTATTNEAARQLAETGRVSAETIRASAETARASAETARATAENTRASAESTRIAAENTRASAESARIAAENARVSEFSTIEANAQAALSYIGPSEASSTASAAHAAGSYFIYNGKLYQATADIAIGDTITSGTNCAQVPEGAMGEVSNLKSALIATYPQLDLTELYNKNKYINLKIAPGNVVDVTQNDSDTFACYIKKVYPGDKFTITGSGSNTERLWGLLNNNYVMLSNSGANHVATNEDVVVSVEGYFVSNVRMANNYSLFGAQATSEQELFDNFYKEYAFERIHDSELYNAIKYNIFNHENFQDNKRPIAINPSTGSIITEDVVASVVLSNSFKAIAGLKYSILAKYSSSGFVYLFNRRTGQISSSVRMNSSGTRVTYYGYDYWEYSFVSDEDVWCCVLMGLANYNYSMACIGNIPEEYIKYGVYFVSDDRIKRLSDFNVPVVDTKQNINSIMQAAILKGQNLNTYIETNRIETSRNEHTAHDNAIARVNGIKYIVRLTNTQSGDAANSPTAKVILYNCSTGEKIEVGYQGLQIENDYTVTGGCGSPNIVSNSSGTKAYIIFCANVGFYTLIRCEFDGTNISNYAFVRMDGQIIDNTLLDLGFQTADYNRLQANATICLSDGYFYVGVNAGPTNKTRKYFCAICKTTDFLNLVTITKQNGLQVVIFETSVWVYDGYLYTISRPFDSNPNTSYNNSVGDFSEIAILRKISLQSLEEVDKCAFLHCSTKPILFGSGGDFYLYTSPQNRNCGRIYKIDTTALAHSKLIAEMNGYNYAYFVQNREDIDFVSSRQYSAYCTFSKSILT